MTHSIRLLGAAALIATLTVVAATLIAAPGLAQSMQTAHTLKLDHPSNRPAAAVTDFAWLAGRWRSEGAESVSEETWTPPSGGTMTGTFKVIRDGRTSMYEFFVLEQEGESVGIKLKHFNADLSGWEEKEDYTHFPLVKVEPDAAYFDGMTYRRVDDATVETFVAVSNQDGVVSELAFRWKRIGHSAGEAKAGSNE